MNQDNIKEYIVCLNGGSGVIFQPSEENQSYILTAKHVLNTIANHPYNGSVHIDYFTAAGNSFTRIEPFELVEGTNYFPHPDATIDIAIITVDRIPCPINLVTIQNVRPDTGQYQLVGFPSVRRAGTPLSVNWIRHDNLTVGAERAHGKREGTVENNATRNELVGASGAGIFIIRDGHLYLAGIQNQITAVQEAMGRVEFTPISHFQNIVDIPGSNLETILPFYLKNFSFLKSEAFTFEIDALDENHLAFVRNYLINKTQDVINSGVTPIVIKSFFGEKLLLDHNRPDILNTSQIWKVWLEFLTIMNIVKYENFGEAELGEIFNSYRLKFSNCVKDWTSLINTDLLYSDYTGLKIEGKVFVQTVNSPANNYILPRDKIRNIAKTYDKSKFKTDQGIHPFTHFTFIHADHLKKEFLQKRLALFENINDEAELLTILKKEYNDLFSATI
jgi:hypothetical protein